MPNIFNRLLPPEYKETLKAKHRVLSQAIYLYGLTLKIVLLKGRNTAIWFLRLLIWIHLVNHRWFLICVAPSSIEKISEWTVLRITVRDDRHGDTVTKCLLSDMTWSDKSQDKWQGHFRFYFNIPVKACFKHFSQFP